MTEWLISSGALILAVLLLRFLLRKRIRPRLQYALWLLVALRLLLPLPLLNLGLSLNSLLSSVPAYTAVRESVETAAQSLTEPSVVWSEGTKPQWAAEAAIQSYEEPAALRVPIFAVIWIGGSLIFGLWVLARNLLVRRAIFRARIIQLDYNAPLPVYAVPALPSPCLLHGRIYLPLELKDPTAQRHAIAHEVAHQKHHDGFFSLLRCLFCVLFWWRPLVWAAAIVSRADMELACDEEAIETLGEPNRLAYGRTLVDLVCVRPLPGSPIVLATTMTSGTRALRRRIQTLSEKAITRRWAAILLCAALLVCCFFTFTGSRPHTLFLSSEGGSGYLLYTLNARPLPEELASPLIAAIDRAVWVPLSASQEERLSDNSEYTLSFLPKNAGFENLILHVQGRSCVLTYATRDAWHERKQHAYRITLGDELAAITDFAQTPAEGLYTTSFGANGESVELRAAEDGYLLLAGEKEIPLQPVEDSDHPLYRVPYLSDYLHMGYVAYASADNMTVLLCSTSELRLMSLTPELRFQKEVLLWYSHASEEGGN